MFWKKKGEESNSEPHPNNDKVDIEVLGEHDGIVEVKVTYLREPNTQHPTKQGGWS